MPETDTTSQNLFNKSFRVFRIEPLGRLLDDYLHLPLVGIWGLFIFIYFGILLILHNYIGTPQPLSLKALLENPTGSFYYPHLFSIVYDMIGNPLQAVLLIYFRRFLPQALFQLQQDDLFVLKNSTSKRDRFLRFLWQNRIAQVVIMIGIPLLNAIIGIVVDSVRFSGIDIPGTYAFFLSFIGRYVQMAILMHIFYIFIIMSQFFVDIKFYLGHPDQCSGLAPFGNIAIGIYLFIFVYTLMRVAAGAGEITDYVGTRMAPIVIIFVWLFFLFVTLLIFERFIYFPHSMFQRKRMEYLRTSSYRKSYFHQQISFCLMTTVRDSQRPLGEKSSIIISDDIEMLENWEKLDEHIINMPSWPIPRQVFGRLAIITNPLLPILLPGFIDLIKSLAH